MQLSVVLLMDMKTACIDLYIYMCIYLKIFVDPGVAVFMYKLSTVYPKTCT